MKGKGHRWKTVVTEPRSGASEEFTVEALTFVKAADAARSLFMAGVDPSVPLAQEIRARLVVDCQDLGPVKLDDLPPSARR